MVAANKLLQGEVDRLTKRRQYIQERKTNILAEYDRLLAEGEKVEESIAQSNTLLLRLQETY